MNLKEKLLTNKVYYQLKKLSHNDQYPKDQSS
jgi:hypothetical protein